MRLGAWLANLRRGTDPRWAGPILIALGMTGLPAAAAGQPGTARPRLAPVFTVVIEQVDQARRQRVTRAADAPLGDAELVITGLRETIENRLVPRPASDEEFPWRDAADPALKVRGRPSGH